MLTKKLFGFRSPSLPQKASSMTERLRTKLPLRDLLDRNAKWAKGVTADDPDFFSESAKGQAPKYLWIGCADSRVPPNQVINQPPGAVFVHRNIANVVVNTDFNCLSVMEYAVKYLKVEHIIVCGHYGCGGVAAALGDQQLGLIDNWLRHIRDVHQKNLGKIRKLFPLTKQQQLDLMCELNVIESAKNVCHTSIVQAAWQRGQKLSVHGWIYALKSGRLHDLDVTVSSPEELPDAYKATDASIKSKQQA